MAHPYLELPRPIVFGHRGACGEAPENTLASFERALAQGAAIVETDLHRTADGHVVVSHDPDVSRMTEGVGRIDQISLEALQRLDAGHRFTPDAGASFPFRGTGVRIPTLREVFEAFPDTRFNLEIKPNDPLLIAETVRLVQAAGREDATLLAAAEDDTMAALRMALAETGAKPAVGASVGDVLGFVAAAIAGDPAPPGPMALQIPAQFGGRSLVTGELLRYAHANDVQVHVWTVNDEAEMRHLLDLGVDGVMSDFPGRLRRVVDERRAG